MENTVSRGGSKAAVAGEEEGKEHKEQGKGDKNNKNGEGNGTDEDNEDNNEDNDENNNDSDENNNDDEDEDEDEDEDDVVGTEDNKFDAPTSPNQAKVVQMAYNEERSKKERRERRQRIRDESWESSDAKKRLGQFIDSVGEGPYTMAQLDKCSELVLGARNSLPAPFCHRFDGNLRANDPRIAHWTKPMLLGSPISDKYMAFIKTLLADLAEKELQRRKA